MTQQVHERVVRDRVLCDPWRWQGIIPPRERPRLLLADGDADRLDRLRRGLDPEIGEVVACSTHGRHAVELASLLKPDVAVIGWDLSVPGIGGAVTAHLMRRACPQVSLILLVPTACLASTADLERLGVLTHPAEDSSMARIRAAVLGSLTNAALHLP